MAFGFVLDWLQWSTDTAVELKDVLPQDWPISEVVHTAGRPGYNRHTGAAGIMRHWHDSRKEQGQLWTLTGRSLDALRAAAFGDARVLEMAIKPPSLGAFSRIDLACDVVVPHARARDVYSAIMNGGVKLKTTKRSSFVTSNDGEDWRGDTVYIGSRKSHRFLRVYDKGKKENVEVEGGNWLRIELEVKGKRAQVVARAVQRHGIARVWRSQIREMLSVEQPLWLAETLQGEETKVNVPRSDKTRGDDWLYTVAMPKVVEKVASDGAARDYFFMLLKDALGAENAGREKQQS